MGWIEAGRAIDRIAHEYRDAKRMSYNEAVRLAMKENPNLAREYGNSADETPTVEKRHDMSASELTMLRLTTDKDWARSLANGVLDDGARGLAGSHQQGFNGQINNESYRAALRQLMAQHPTLGEAASSGRVADGDWELAATLVPGIASEVWNERKIAPLNLRAGNYGDSRSSVRRYSSDSHVRYDAAGHEYRSYTFSR